MRTVVQLSDAIVEPDGALLFVMVKHVLMVHIVRLATTERHVHALNLLKEMEMFTVQNVRQNKDILGIHMLLIILFIFLAVKLPNPECRMDRDCPQSLVGIQKKCQNPCQTRNPCIGNQECHVNDRLNEKKSIACSCPAEFVSTANGYCNQGSQI